MRMLSHLFETGPTDSLEHNIYFQLCQSRTYKEAAASNTSSQASSSQQALRKARAISWSSKAQVYAAFPAASSSAAAGSVATKGLAGYAAALLRR